MIDPMNFDDTPSVVFKFATGAVCLKLGPNQIVTNASTDIEPGGLRSSNNFCSIPDIVSLIFPLNIFLLSHRYILFSDVVGLLSPSDIFHSSRHGQSSPHRVGVIFVQFS